MEDSEQKINESAVITKEALQKAKKKLENTYYSEPPKFILPPSMYNNIRN